MSQYFNNKSHYAHVKQVTASIFADISPLDPRTMLRRLDDIPQNVDNLKDIFERIGGYTFFIKGEGIFHYEQESIKAFIWIPRCSID